MRHKLASISTDLPFSLPALWAVAVLSVWPFDGLAQSGNPATIQANKPAGVIVASRGTVRITRNNTGFDAKAGAAILTGDSISTGNSGWTQIALRDHTLFSLAENSQLGIDQFRLDEDPEKSRLFSQLISGEVKFISGRIASQNEMAMEVKFGTVTAAIRGTSGVISRAPTGQSQLTVLSGQIDLTDSENRTLSQLGKSGWGVDISAAGRPSALRERPAGQLAFLLAQTASNRPAELSASGARPDTGTDIARIAATQTGAQPLSRLLASGETGTLSPEQQLLFDQLDDAQKYDSANNQITIDNSLLDYALSGGQPLWMRYFGAGYFSNPPRPEDQIDYDIYNSHYRGLVSERYSGSVTFSHDGFALVPLGGIDAGGIAGMTATLDYDTAELSGQFWLADVRIEDVSFNDSQPHPLGFSGLSADMLAVDMPVGALQLNGRNAQNTPLGATASISASFGSITDGEGVLDGRLGLFAVTVTPDAGSAPVLAGQAILGGQ